MSNYKEKTMAEQAKAPVKTGIIQLSPEQEQIIGEAIKGGIVSSVDEFIERAIAALRPPRNQDENARREAVRRMEEFGQKYHLSPGEPITRETLHEGHRY